MLINTDNIVSMTDANQNFSKVAKLVDEKGLAVILRNNVPKYVLMEITEFEKTKTSDDDIAKDIAKKILQKNKKAFEELAK